MKEHDHVQPPAKSGECGAVHSDCSSTWKGTCDRPAGHDGSHHCSQCNASF